MKKIILSLCLLLPVASWAEFDCKPAELPNSFAQGGYSSIGINSLGFWVAWRCKQPVGILQLWVVRWSAVSVSVLPDVLAFPSDMTRINMNAMLAKYKATDPWTDPALVEVWKPDAARIQGMK